MLRLLLCAWSILALSGCRDLLNSALMSADCKAVLDRPKPAQIALESHAEANDDGGLDWTVSAFSPGPLHQHFDLRRAEGGHATASVVRIEPGARGVLLRATTRADRPLTFAGPRTVYTHTATGPRRELSPVTLLFPVDPEVAYFSQTPTDGFGFLRRPSHTVEKGNFEAVDINAPLGTPIVAPADGVVVYTFDDSPDVPCNHLEHIPYANLLTMVGDDDTTLTLGHLARDSILVEPGARVRRGDPIARVGMSGGGGVAHIHLVAEALGPEGIDSVPIRFEPCGDAAAVWTPRNGPPCR